MSRDIAMPLTISRFDLPREPYWLDLPFGVRIKVRPLDAALFAAATRLAADILSEAQPGFVRAIEAGESAKAVSDGVWAATLTTAVAQLAILDWTGVVDEESDPCLPDREAIRLVFDPQLDGRTGISPALRAAGGGAGRRGGRLRARAEWLFGEGAAYCRACRDTGDGPAGPVPRPWPPAGACPDCSAVTNAPHSLEGYQAWDAAMHATRLQSFGRAVVPVVENWETIKTRLRSRARSQQPQIVTAKSL